MVRTGSGKKVKMWARRICKGVRIMEPADEMGNGRTATVA